MLSSQSKSFFCLSNPKQVHDLLKLMNTKQRRKTMLTMSDTAKKKKDSSAFEHFKGKLNIERKSQDGQTEAEPTEPSL